MSPSASTSLSSRKLKIFIHAMDGSGHMNACVGVAQALVKRGHKVSFLLNAAFAGQFAKFGFDEVVLHRTPAEGNNDQKNEERKNPVKVFAKMIKEMGLLGPATPLERIKEKKKESDKVFSENLRQTTREFNPQIQAAIERDQPDLIILDHFLIPPAVPKSGIPWLLLFSGNPLAIFNSENLPPFSSGYSVANSDRELWQEFLEYARKKYLDFKDVQHELFAEFGYEPKEASELPFYNNNSSFIPQCKYGYIYGCPKELDYDDVITIPDNYIQIDAFCREVPEPFQLPEEITSRKPDQKLIYFSLGSMGSVDVDLVKKISSLLSKTGHKIIVSKGPLADEYELPENCWGEGYLPQTRILPLVDLVITHGGNNTVTETFSFGRPMIVMPLFGDQYDNAQRIHEKGYGIRIDPYTFNDESLLNAIDQLLNDKALHSRLAQAAKRIETFNSKEKACEKIEQLVERYQSV